MKSRPWIKCLLVTALLCIFTNTFSAPLPTHHFISQLKNSDKFVHAKLVTNQFIDKSNLYQQIKSSNYHLPMNVESHILKLASGVKSSQQVWQFQDENLNEQISHLFKVIANAYSQLGFDVQLSQYDLFHGHVFATHDLAGKLEEIGILFHAKEYPNDLPLGNPAAEKNSPFSTNTFGYAYRNFIWLASTGFIYDIDSHSEMIFPRYFLPDNIDDPDIILLYLQARTLMLDNIAPDIELLGDVNYFEINGQTSLFFTYYPFHIE